ncbi:DUF4446 family protein [Nocardioides sp. C4-1]|uniref:DUF4446 family protein n=1 Tax=Nocardioides sp. C4-1 TaxID=3151851 RepID=UPI0032659E56
MALALAIVALVLAAAALAVAVQVLRRTRARADGSDLPGDVVGLRREVAALRAEAGLGFRHLAVVRYDAHADTGGHLSWSLALLDDRGDGVVVSSIHGRSEARTYAKSVATWKSEQQLSPEESEAIGAARA